VSCPATAKGFIARGFEDVQTAFERNFAQRREVGAAFAAVVDGEPVVDLWGGLSDRVARLGWEEEALVPVFSGSKGLVAICLLLLVERGELQPTAPVAERWPEFGKEHILVRDVVAHTARLPGFGVSVGFGELTEHERLASLLAAQQPSPDPRADLCYHAVTFGSLCAELVRRVSGRSIGRFFAEEVAAPLELDIWIGLPEDQEARVARLELAETWPQSPALRPETHGHDALLRSIWGNPPIFDRERFRWNSRAYHAAEIPALSAVGSARSLARLYGSLEQLLSADTLELARRTLADGWDEAHGVARRFGFGFELQTERKELGPPPDAFGHSGAGGSIHGRWPNRRVGFSYVTNLMRDDDDGRAQSLLRALYGAVS
jgi:CubicO group peptidase (beta-lactamase class C family)